MSSKPVALCILDGWGMRDAPEGNAPQLAHTPNFDRLMRKCPTATLRTHGKDVGLPEGQMGNSEVGHTNIGAGRVVWMDLPKIDAAIEDGSFGANPALGAFAEGVQGAGGRVHLAGLVSPGGVHSHQSHMIAAAQALVARGLEVLVHVITDGRDVAPKSARDHVAAFEAALPEGARIVTVIGRYFALDRDTRWDRVAAAYHAITAYGGANPADVPHGGRFPSADAAITAAYNDHGVTDEFIRPSVIGDYGGVGAGDGLFFANFRADRAREILAALGDPTFDAFDRGAPPFGALLGMVDYSTAHSVYMTTMFPKQDIANTLGEWVAAQGKRQFRLAETEKYPHVTFFLNGGREAAFDGEDRYMPPSPRVATYDLAPEMSAPEVTARFVAAIDEGYDLIVTNYANPDMVGHTGDLEAAIRACEAVDAGLGQVLGALERVGGCMLICADHGNCEVMIDPESGGPHTAHTTNLVPLILVGGAHGVGLADGRLGDLAPTLLALMGVAQPPEMTGESLLT